MLVFADFSKRHFRPDRHFAELFDVDRRSVFRSDCNIGDIFSVLKQANAAYVVALRANLQVVCAHIRIALGDGIHHLRNRNVESDQLIGIKIDVEFFGIAAEAHNINDTGYLFKLTFQDPILRDFQIHEALAIADELVSIDFTHCRSRRKLRFNARRQVSHLKTVQHFLPVKVVIGFVAEVTLDIGQAEQRNRSDMIKSGHPIQLCLERYGDLPLHLFGRPPGILRDDFDGWW